MKNIHKSYEVIEVQKARKHNISMIPIITTSTSDMMELTCWALDWCNYQPSRVTCEVAKLDTIKALG